MIKTQAIRKFRLSSKFVSKYKDIKPDFGFNGLGEITYKRTYSRIKEDGTNEEWFETVERVVNGTYNMQKDWIEQNGLEWDTHKAQESAKEMYDRIFTMKFLPPGRGLWAMGSPITEEKGLYAALNNCGFTSTENIKDDPTKAFCFMMDMSMLGVGVGFDVEGENKIKIKGVDRRRRPEIYKIPDTREGWVESLRLLLEANFLGLRDVDFDYSEIREAGQPIKTFGGISSGPEPLRQLHENLKSLFDKNQGENITGIMIADIMNMIGVCVVSGNVRRSAQIIFGDYLNDEYLDLKNYEVNPHRAAIGWASNNSVFAELGMDYSNCAERTRINGEPGYGWLENMRGYSRMNNGPDFKDAKAAGANPCVEQTLFDKELCCLVESFPFRHESKEDYIKTLKYAYLYAKTVTLGKTHWPETNRVLLRNRRIGCSMSGIGQFLQNRGIHQFKDWCEDGYEAIEQYDTIYSDWFAVPKSIKKTSIKPSGSVSLLAGAWPGMHYPEAEYYIRRIRVSENSELIPVLKKAGYKIEKAEHEPMTMVVEVPVWAGLNTRTNSEVSLWEQMSLAAFLQRYWADNQVSCTVTFDPETEGYDIEKALNYFQYQLKGISFLPKVKKGAYAQMPYESITEKEYKKVCRKLKALDLRGIQNTDIEVEKFCDGDKCQI